MLFRIVGPHQHQAVIDGRTFSCRRESAATDAGFTIRWSAFKDNARLKSDCRTLNEAKNLCRASASQDARREN